MKVLVDAHLPERLAKFLSSEGFDAIHTLDLPLQNRSPDTQINKISVDEQRIVIPKDADFVDSFLLKREPWKLLLISTGNIRNNDLDELIKANIETIRNVFDSGAEFVELNRTSLLVHV
jgi:predicted nuclease of predicted toxin-antitoxin system